MGDVMTRRRQLQMMKEAEIRSRKRKMGRMGPPKPTTMGTIEERPRMTRGMIERRKEMEKRNKRALPPATGMLTGGQAKIAAKAPPFNKIDGKDFAVLRKEKAKGRGKGLQDEKMKPGKTIKAKKSKFVQRRLTLAGLGKLRKDPTKAINRVGVKDRYGMDIKPKTSQLGKDLASQAAKAAKATRIGKIAAGVAGAALLGKAVLEKMYEKRTGKKPFTKRPDKKMGGGMMMQRPMMAKVGMMTEKDKEQKRVIKKLANRFKGVRRGGAERDVVKGMGGYMGGGMMMRPNPVGYKTGKSVKVKCKLGKNKPTKMY